MIFNELKTYVSQIYLIKKKLINILKIKNEGYQYEMCEWMQNVNDRYIFFGNINLKFPYL